MNGAFMGSPNPNLFLLPGADTVMGLFGFPPIILSTFNINLQQCGVKA